MQYRGAHGMRMRLFCKTPQPHLQNADITYTRIIMFLLTIYVRVLWLLSAICILANRSFKTILAL
jgi:hypothetical protein